MGRGRRIRPKRLAEKLLTIRNQLDCSLSQLAKMLSDDNLVTSRTAVSSYELDDNEPPLTILLRYARLANIYVDVLIDDELNLPNKIPAAEKLSV